MPLAGRADMQPPATEAVSMPRVALTHGLRPVVTGVTGATGVPTALGTLARGTVARGADMTLTAAERLITQPLTTGLQATAPTTSRPVTGVRPVTGKRATTRPGISLLTTVRASPMETSRPATATSRPDTGKAATPKTTPCGAAASRPDTGKAATPKTTPCGAAASRPPAMRQVATRLARPTI